VTLNGHHWLARGIAGSFAIVPLGAAQIGAEIPALAYGLGTSVLVMGLRIAGPVMAALLLNIERITETIARYLDATMRAFGG